jgi:hypothetical protein
MINTPPASSLQSLQGNVSTYIPTGTATSATNVVLHNVNKGNNVVYVVAVDNEGNYSPTNKIQGAFMLNSTNPDPAQNLAVSDASIKELSLWRASLAWNVPAYKGTGSLSYIVQRSENNSTWTTISTLTGNSYVDSLPESMTYYWRVGTVDTSPESIASPSYTNAVSLIPKGKYLTPASLVSGPTVTDISTKRATINWVTSRDSDSRVAYGVSSGNYYSVEGAVSTPVTEHTIQLQNLRASTTYFYIVRWTDEDGNVGESQELQFRTSAQPTATDVKESGIGLFSALISYTVKGAKAVKIEYGKSLSYGAQISTNTSTNSSSYSVELTDLEDGVVYHYRINMQDLEGDWYPMEDNLFKTLPRPRVTNIDLQQARNTASSTVVVSWKTNVEASSILTYHTEVIGARSHESVDPKYITGAHKMTISGLSDDSTYVLQIKARDHYGNEAVSDLIHFTTATDTRPPGISSLIVDGENSTIQGDLTQADTGVQLVVSWTTDEPATSQVEFAEGAGSTYTNKTFEDSTLTTEHLVVIPNLTPAKVYHLRVISKDRSGNETVSYDVVTVTPKKSDSALDLIFNSLKGTFSF